MISMDGKGLVLFEGFRLDLPGGGLFRLERAGIASRISISARALDLLVLFPRAIKKERGV
jgi:hypothetical protein